MRPRDILSEVLGLRAWDETSSHTARLGLVGGPGQPKFAVPLGWRRATWSSCTSYPGLRDRGTRLRRRAAGVSLMVTSRRPVVSERLCAEEGEGSLIALLSSLLDTADFGIAVGLGGGDELWKPTLQLFTPEGAPLAFVKVAHTDLTAHLVRTEGEALDVWSRVAAPALLVPTLVANTLWRERPLLVVAPLPVDSRRAADASVDATPVRALDPPLGDVPLEDSTWWRARRAVPVEPAVRDVLDEVERRQAGVPRSWARWHGDWVPWNVARSAGRLVAWDWEYSEAGAPVGLDEVHRTYQMVRFGRQRPVREALAAVRVTVSSSWLVDAHKAMLVSRAATLAAVNGRPVTDHEEVLDGVAASW